MSLWFKPFFLKLEYVSESPGGPIKTQIAGPAPWVSDWVDLEQDQEYAFLTSSYDMDGAGEPPFENPSLSTVSCVS